MRPRPAARAASGAATAGNASGLATTAGLAFPAGLAVNSAGNLVIADSGNDRIRMVTR